MGNINRVTISGNLTRDPELRASAAGVSFLNLRLANNEGRKNAQTGEWEDYTNYVDFVVIGKRADGIAPYLHRGDKVTIDGKLSYREWEDKETGAKRSSISIVANEVEFQTKRDGESGHRGGQSASSPSAPPAFEDDIPF